MNIIDINRQALSAEEEIFSLARKHGVSYQETELDRLGNAITRLAGDEVELDEALKLVLALRRADLLSKSEAHRLRSQYLRAKYE